MFKTALNKNIIPHTWNLANIVPIPKPNKDTDKGNSYRPISLLSVIAKTLEKSLLPYITANIPNTPMQHGYKTQHSTVSALHTQNNTVAKGSNQMAPPARIITVALDISTAFDTIHIHTLIRNCYRQTFHAQSLSSVIGIMFSAAILLVVPTTRNLEYSSLSISLLMVVAHKSQEKYSSNDFLEELTSVRVLGECFDVLIVYS